jgi:uncharacterized protein
MPLSDEAQYQTRKAQRTLAERAARQESLRAAAEQAADLLVEEFGARRVWIFGSVLQAWFHEASDLDLAVEGVALDRVGQAWERVQQALGLPVDLVALEEAEDSLRRKVNASGELVRDAEAARRG